MSPPIRIVVAQSVATLVMTVVWFITGIPAGWSSLVAGLAVVVPNAYFAWRVTEETGGGKDAAAASEKRDHSLDEARALLGNSVVKQLLSLGLLVLIFSTLRPEPLAFFATFIVVQLVHWVASLGAGPPRSGMR